MRKSSRFGIILLSLAIVPLSQGSAQSSIAAPPDAYAPLASTVPSDQAPDNMTGKVTELVHAGKYADAQQLTEALLITYPNDRRLIKAKELIEKLLTPAASSTPAPDNSQPGTPAVNTTAAPLAGLDRVDYNALIVLARQAQQTAELDQQSASLRQFMDQSSAFLQKHPEQMLLWQLRAAAAMSLNDPIAGYEAGQRLLAAGAADSNDPAVQQLMAQIRNKGWLNWQQAERAESNIKYGWIVGTWSGSFFLTDKKGHIRGSGPEQIEFSKSESGVDAYLGIVHGTKSMVPNLKISVLDSGDIRCETGLSEAVWVPNPCETFDLRDENKTMTITFASKQIEDKYGYKYSWSLHKGMTAVDDAANHSFSPRSK